MRLTHVHLAAPAYATYKGAVLAQWAHVGFTKHYDRLGRHGLGFQWLSSLGSAGSCYDKGDNLYIDHPLVT